MLMIGDATSLANLIELSDDNRIVDIPDTNIDFSVNATANATANAAATANETLIIYNISPDQYEALYNVCGHYFNLPQYVYKKCNDGADDWLIILERTPNTRTNEYRQSVVNVKTAKHRGTEFNVTMIVNIYDPTKTLDTFTNTAMGWISTITYKVGDIIKPEHPFEEDLNQICASGIHFFIDVFKAIGWGRWPNEVTHFTGLWIDHGDNGENTRLCTYFNGKKHGTEKLWSDDIDGNPTLSETEYVHGLQHGIGKTWYENGQILSEEYYLNGIRNGSYKEWYKNGQLRVKCNYLDGKIHGSHIQWYKNGVSQSVDDYSNGIRHGVYIHWYENDRKKSHGRYSDGKLQDNHMEWYENGQKQSDCDYLNGQRHGRCIGWYSNGQKQFEKSNEKQHGTHYYWYNNGQLKEEMNYFDNKLHGVWKKYSLDGQLSSKNCFVNGEQADSWWNYLFCLNLLS